MNEKGPGAFTFPSFHLTMHRITFFTLLASFLVLYNVEALPLRRGVGLVTIPIQRLESRADLHPQILLQQHVNRGQRRLARMAGVPGPSDDELATSLHKRVALLPPDARHAKRYNHGPIQPVASDPLQVKQGGGILAAAADPAPAASLANNTLPLDIFANDIGYFATVKIGTPPQDFKLLVDSGSADTWVGSENCRSGRGGCGNHNFLGPQTSSSFVENRRQFRVVYGTGQVSGNIVTDNLDIAGLQLENHKFGVAKQESAEFSANGVPFDGLMGLAQSKLSQQRTLTPIEALARNGLIAEAITSYKISRAADDLNDGEITFGGLNPAKFSVTTLTTVDNLSKVGFWEAAIDAVAVNGRDLRLLNRTAILDTGTTLILAPTTDAEALHAAIPGAKSDGQGGFTIPCTTTAIVSMTFGSFPFTIDPRDLSFGPVDANNPTGDCVSGISSSGESGPGTQWLIGDVFLKNAYLSTDVGRNQISLAKLA